MSKGLTFQFLVEIAGRSDVSAFSVLPEAGRFGSMESNSRLSDTAMKKSQA